MRSSSGSGIGAIKDGPSRGLSVAVRVGDMSFHCLGTCRSWLFGPDGADWTDLENDARAELIKANPLRTVYRLRCGSHEVYAKLYRTRTLADRLKWLLGGAPSGIEFERLGIARSRGVAAPEPLAWAAGRAGSKPLAILITRSIGAVTSLEDILWRNEGTDAGEHAISAEEGLVAAGRLAATLHCGGIEHRDLHPGNILLGAAVAGDEVTGWITDLQDSRVEQRSGHASADPTRRDRMANLAVLLAAIRGRTSPAQQQQFIETYLLTIHPHSHWSGGDMSGYVPRLYALAERHHRRMLRRRDRRCMRNSRYSRRIRLGHGWSGRVFLEAKHPCPDSYASQQRFTGEEWQEALADPSSLLGGEIIKEGTRATVTGGTIKVGGNELQVVFKHSRLRGGLRGIGQAIRQSRAMKQWHMAHALISRQLPTAWPLAALEHHRFGFLCESVFVTELIPDAPSLRRLLRQEQLPARGQERSDLAKSIGRMIAQIEMQGLRHRDCKLSNIVIRERAGDGGYRPYLVDLDGLSIRPRWLAGRAHEAIIRAAGSEPERFRPGLRDLLTVFRAYLEAMNAPEAHNIFMRKQLWRFVAAGAAAARARTCRNMAKRDQIKSPRKSSVEAG